MLLLTFLTFTRLTTSPIRHWRYISAFHGPWLQLPHEILSTLAHSNFLSPPPRQTDPSVLFDLLKIRKLVDDAADLAVRAQNGTASSALNNSSNGLPGGDALGLGGGRGGQGAKLSPERKYRMRELATSKLAMAYRLDEVAASVATMQSASALDTVAMLVLQRNPANTDAKYVKFFHEKIPSRMMAEYTSLAPLDEIVANEPGHAQAAVLRTRALTRIFKEDVQGAVRDLTESLAICRLEMGKQMRMGGTGEIVPAKKAGEEADKRRMWTRDWVHDNKVAEEEQPRGMEMQLLFQRGNQYLSLASQSVRVALEEFRAAQRATEEAQEDAREGAEAEPPKCKTAEETEAYRRALEARELVRKNAKRALKDYTTFLGHLDYAFATTSQEEKVNGNGNGSIDCDRNGSSHRQPTVLDDESELLQSTALVRRERNRDSSPQAGGPQWPTSTPPTIYDIPTLLSPSPPPNLPPFPPTPTPSTSTAVAIRSSTPAPTPTSQQLHHHETITYHPLLPETLHAFLLAHALLQTPPTTLFRIANNVARLARLADGYPFFLSARSPARADWAEVLRKTGNWIGLGKTWEGLLKLNMDGTNVDGSSGNVKAAKTKNKAKTNGKIDDSGTAPAPAAGLEVSSAALMKTNGTSKSAAGAVNGFLGKVEQNGVSSDQLRERIHKEAVIEALGDERVVDDDTFQRAVEARERRAWREMEADKQLEASVGGEEQQRSSILDKTIDDVDAVVSNGDDAKTASPGPEVDTSVTTTTTTTTTNSKVAESENTPTTIKKPTYTSSTTPKPPKPSREPVAKDEEYLIGTERASAIAAWLLEAPAPGTIVDAAGEAKGGVRKAKGRKRRVPLTGAGGQTGTDGV